MTTNRDGCTLCPGAMCDLCGSGYLITCDPNTNGHVCAFCRHGLPMRIKRTDALIEAVELQVTRFSVMASEVIDAIVWICKPRNNHDH